MLGAVLAVTSGWARFGGEINALGVNLARPDAYVSTPALSRLPRDMLKAPIARDLLTEDFAFYYEEHEDRLGLQGALKRIAYEHNTTLTDKLLEMVLDEPAEIAWWVDGKGAPRHWLLAMTRGTLAKALQGAATIATGDRQLKLIDTLRLNGRATPVYALTLSPRRTLAIAAMGNRVVVLSDPGLLFDAKQQVDVAAREVVAQLLSGDAASQTIYRRGLGLGEPGTGHTLVASAGMLSFGYQHFFPGLKALRLDLAAGGGALNTQLRVESRKALPIAPTDHALWQALPMNPAACTLLPADWARAKAVVNQSPSSRVTPAQKTAWSGLADQLEGPAAICWYAKSQWHTPLWVALTKSDATHTSAALGTLFEWIAPADAASVGSPDPGTSAAAAKPQGIERWQRDVRAPWGQNGTVEQGSYRMTLARQGRWITFSPDADLVALALDAQARRYPSVVEGLPQDAATLAVVSPRQVADLAQREAFAVIPAENELFLQAAKTHLVPRLNALRKLPAARAVTTGLPDENGWVAVQWQPLVQAAGPKADKP